MIAGPADVSTWHRRRVAPRICLSARSPGSTAAIALVVGTVANSGPRVDTRRVHR